jgi:hypothetical protein
VNGTALLRALCTGCNSVRVSAWVWLLWCRKSNFLWSHHHVVRCFFLRVCFRLSLWYVLMRPGDLIGLKSCRNTKPVALFSRRRLSWAPAKIHLVFVFTFLMHVFHYALPFMHLTNTT